MSAPKQTPAKSFGRYEVQRLEIDGSWRPLAPGGKPLAYDTPALAEAVRRGYLHLGAGVRVHDTKGAAE